jgi:hypothetical protein
MNDSKRRDAAEPASERPKGRPRLEGTILWQGDVVSPIDVEWGAIEGERQKRRGRPEE